MNADGERHHEEHEAHEGNGGSSFVNVVLRSGNFLSSWEDFEQKAAKVAKPDVLRPAAPPLFPLLPSVQILFGCGCAALDSSW